jgi:hypothetical protein
MARPASRRWSIRKLADWKPIVGAGTRLANCGSFCQLAAYADRRLQKARNRERLSSSSTSRGVINGAKLVVTAWVRWLGGLPIASPNLADGIQIETSAGSRSGALGNRTGWRPHRSLA